MKGSLSYLRKTQNRPKPYKRVGVEYLHHFNTGHQELVFDNHEAAKKFAVAESLEYKGPDQIVVQPRRQ